MKQLLFLVAGVLIILGAWWLVGTFSATPKGPAKLFLPVDPSDKPALIRSANQLWNAAPDYYEPMECIGLMRRLADQLDDGQWRAVTSPVFLAWQNHRNLVAVRGPFISLTQKLLPRFASRGTLFDLSGLVRIAKEKSFDSAPINAVLGAIASAPLPTEGIEDSRFWELILATVHARDLARAKEYLSKISWVGGPSEEAAASVGRMKFLVEQCLAIEKRKPDLQAIVRSWREQEGKAWSGMILCPILEDVAIQVLQTSDSWGPGLKMKDAFTASAEVPGAEGYWNRVTVRSVDTCVWGDELKCLNMEVLVNSFEKHFKKPEFAFRLWMKAGGIALTSAPQDPLRAARLLERALVVSATDTQLVAVVKILVPCYLRAKEFGKARKALESALSHISDPAKKKELDLLQAEVKKKVAEDDARVAKQEKSLDQDLRRGRLSNMKDRLFTARKYGHPAEEIHALEKVVKDLERDVTE